jgi:TP901 family phage tail tape measure protein
MTAAYEAKARISVDTSQLASAAREAARNLGTLTTVTRELTTALRDMERQGRSAAASLRPFSSMMSKLASDSRQASGAAEGLSGGVRENAQAFNTASDASARFAAQQNLTTSAMRTMAREIVDTDRRISELDRAMDMGLNTNGELDASYRTLTQRLRGLRQEYDSLSAEQRAGVRAQMDLLMAQRQATEAARDADATVRQLNRQRMEQVRIAARAAEQEAKAAAAAEKAAARERELARSAEQAAQAQRSLGQASAQMATQVDQSTRSLGGVDSSMWALRSSLGEVEGMLYSLQNAAIRTTQALWSNFSEQEMAIAQISRVSQATVVELDEIVGSVRQMSREIPIAFAELGEIAMLGSQVGVSNEALAEFTETVALFSATSEVTADETATLLARIMQMADVPEDRVMDLGAAIANLGSNSAATDREILTTVESIATIGNQAGLSAEAIIGLGGAMASLRIRPELARGAMQRVFNQLEQGARGSGAAMESLTQITQMNQGALIDLLDSGENTDAFFFSIIQGLNQMHEEGTNLVPVLREMGIINTRDVDVLARLAANWDVLSESLASANTEFNRGQYLYEESDRIFNTLTARVQIMINAIQEFGFEAFKAIAPFVTMLVEGATEALRFAQALGAAPLVGFAAVVLAAAAALGTLGIAVTTVGRGYLALRTAQIAVQRYMVSGTAATAANAAATTTAAAAQGRLATATTGTAMAMRGLVAASPLGWLAGLTAGFLGVQAAIDAFSDSTDTSRDRLIEANRTHIEAAGGLGSLQDAIKADTEAWREARTAAAEHIDALDANVGAYSAAADELIRYSAFRTMSARDSIDAARDEREAAEELERAQRGVAGGLFEVGSQANKTNEALAQVTGQAQSGTPKVNNLFEANENLRQSMSDSVQAYDEATVALGLMSYEWGAAVLNSALMETASYDSAEALREMKDAGVDMGRALALEMSEAGAGAEYLNDKADELFMTMNPFEKLWNGLARGIEKLTGGFIDWRTQTAQVVDDIWDLADATEAISAAADSAIESEDLLLQTTFRLADGTEVAASELAEMDATALILEDTISGLGISVDTLVKGFASFIDPLELWKTTQEEVRQATEDTEASLLEMEGGFATYVERMQEASGAQMQWAQNLLTLTREGIPAEVVAGLAEMGVQGAEIVQGLTNEVIAGNTETVDQFVELWNQGGGAMLDNFSIVFSEFIVQAAMAGDQAGVDFVNDLLAQVGAGEISMGEAVDRMTEYATEEFDNADPTLEFYGDATEALEEMNTLLEEIRDAITAAENGGDTTVESKFDGSGALSGLKSWWNDMVTWWNNNVAGSLNLSPGWSDGGMGSSGWLGNKDGGWISGPGGPRQDKIPRMLSDGEFVVNARDAREFGPLLEWINSQHGAGPSAVMVPNFVPDDIMQVPRRPIGVPSRMAPDAFANGAGVRRMSAAERMVFNITNYYPQAEPTSTTVNRALQHGAALNGVL